MANLPVLAQSAPSTLTASVIPQNYANPGFSIAQIVSILRAYRKKIALIAASAFLLIALVVMLIPKTYEATATVLVNYQVNSSLAGREFPFELFGGYLSTQIEMIQSPAVLLPVIDRLNLANDPIYSRGFHGDSANLRDWLENNLAKNLTIEQGHPGSQLINISYADRDAGNAARLANAIADAYAEQHLQRLTEPASERAQRYTEQLEELKKKVDVAQDHLTDFHQRTGLIDSQIRSDTDMTQLSTLQQRLLDVQNERRADEARTNDTFTPQVLGSTLIQTLKTQAAEQQAQLSEMQATLGPNHPQILELQSQLKATQRALADELKTYSSGAGSDLKASGQLEKKLQSAVADERVKVLNGRKLQDEAAKYQVELEAAQTVYKRALDGYDQIMFATSDPSNISIVNRAIRPLQASKPKKLKLLFIGLFGAFFIATIGTLVFELFNRRIRCRDDLEREYGIPVLAEFRFAPTQAALK